MWYQHEHVVHGAAQLSIAGPQDRQATNSIKDFFFFFVLVCNNSAAGMEYMAKWAGKDKRPFNFYCQLVCDLMPIGVFSRTHVLNKQMQLSGMVEYILIYCFFKAIYDYALSTLPIFTVRLKLE